MNKSLFALVLFGICLVHTTFSAGILTSPIVGGTSPVTSTGGNTVVGGVTPSKHHNETATSDGDTTTNSEDSETGETGGVVPSKHHNTTETGTAIGDDETGTDSEDTDTGAIGGVAPSKHHNRTSTTESESDTDASEGGTVPSKTASESDTSTPSTGSTTSESDTNAGGAGPSKTASESENDKTSDSESDTGTATPTSPASDTDTGTTTPSSSSKVTPVQLGGGNDFDQDTFEQDSLDYHNTERKAVGVAELSWSDSLANTAQQWANYMATNAVFQHSGGPYGENIAQATYSTNSLNHLIGMWIGEKTHYIPGCTFPSCSNTTAEVGHYTQMVWSTTTQVGCGWAAGSRYKYLVCQYLVAGNHVGSEVYPYDG